MKGAEDAEIHSLTHSLIVILVFVGVLNAAGPALADYFGPHREVHEYRTETYDVGVWAKPDPTGDSCTHVYGEDCIVCQWEHEPGEPCEDATYWYKTGTETEVVEVTVNYPEATIRGEVENCAERNGWCTGSGVLHLEGSEPVAGYQIIGIEGERNGAAFACGGAECRVALEEGENRFSYWALSDFGDSSRKGELAVRADWTAPEVIGQVLGRQTENGWYIGSATVTGAASDSGSGVAAFEWRLDGGGWQAYAGPVEVVGGEHEVVLRAEDAAGHETEAVVSVRVDGRGPSVEVGAGVALGQGLPIVVYEGESGLERVEVRVADRQGRWPDAVQSYGAGGRTWQGEFEWDRRFGDGTLAPSGAYRVDVRAWDAAGNMGEGESEITIAAVAATEAAADGQEDEDLDAGAVVLRKGEPVWDMEAAPQRRADAGRVQVFHAGGERVQVGRGPVEMKKASGAGTAGGSARFGGAALGLAAALTGYTLARRRRWQKERAQYQAARA